MSGHSFCKGFPGSDWGMFTKGAITGTNKRINLSGGNYRTVKEYPNSKETFWRLVWNSWSTRSIPDIQFASCK